MIAKRQDEKVDVTNAGYLLIWLNFAFWGQIILYRLIFSSPNLESNIILS